MKNIFIVHSKRNKTKEQYKVEHEKIIARIKRKYPNEEIKILENDIISDDNIEELSRYIAHLQYTDLVVFEPKYLYNEGSVIRLCCDLYDIPHINLPLNTYDDE